MFREIPLKNVTVWKDAQARKLNRKKVTELKKSIRSEGLQNPPLVQRGGGRGQYLLISGNHRFAALKSLGARKAKFLVITRDTSYDLEDAKAASVAENIHRTKMDTREIAAACIFLAKEVGKSEADRKLGISMPTFKKLHGFAGVPERIKDLVPRELSRDEATRLYQAVPSVPRALRVAANMAGLDSKTRRVYLQVLARSPRSGHRTLLKRTRKIGVKRKFQIELAMSGARRLSALAEARGTTEARLANSIVRDYLKKRRR